MQSGFWWQLEISKLLSGFVKGTVKKNDIKYNTTDGENEYYLVEVMMWTGTGINKVRQHLWVEKTEIAHILSAEKADFIEIGIEDCSKFDGEFTIDGEIDEFVIAPKNNLDKIEYHYNN